jgi:ATP-dependent DNA ligase
MKQSSVRTCESSCWPLVATRELGLEGVVAKLSAAPYRPGRRDTAWLKLKHPHARDLQVRDDSERWSGTRRSRILPAIAYD